MYLAPSLEARARLARRRVLGREAALALGSVGVLVVAAAYKRAIAVVAHDSVLLALTISAGATALVIGGTLASRRWRVYRAHEADRLQAKLEDLRLAAPVLTPAERHRELERLPAARMDEADVRALRELFEAQPGGVRPLPALCFKDPDDPFRASRGLVVRALAGYPLLAVLAGAVVEAMGEAEVVEWTGPLLLVLPGFLTWFDDDVRDAQPGERFAWSLASLFALIVWIAAVIVAVGD